MQNSSYESILETTAGILAMTRRRQFAWQTRVALRDA
jgi:hypothetical protein